MKKGGKIALPFSELLGKYDSKKLEYLKKKTEQMKLEKEFKDLTKKVKELNDEKTNLQDSNDSQRKEEINQELHKAENDSNILKPKLDDASEDVRRIETELKEICSITETESYLSTYDETQKEDTDIFKVNIDGFTKKHKNTPNIANNQQIKGNFKEPHNMSDKEIVENFKELKSYALDWISFCPKWEHIRLMNLYDQYISNPDNTDYSEEKNVPTAIISKEDAGFYEYTPNRFILGPFKKLFTIPKDETITVVGGPVKKYDKDTYVQVKYVKGQNLQDGSLDERTGYVKTKNITFKGYTMDLLSTIDSSEEFTENLSSSTNELFRKMRYGLITKKRENVETIGGADAVAVQNSFNINHTTNEFPDPALLSDKEIYETFVGFKNHAEQDAEQEQDPDKKEILRKKYLSKCEEWIDCFFIYKSRLSAIYDKFKKQQLKKVEQTDANSLGNTPPAIGDDLELSTDKPQTLLAKIIKKNVNVYIKDNTTLTRVADLHTNDLVKVKIKERSGSTTKQVIFDFLKYENKKYLPIFCLFNSKILHGYVNTDYVSFVTTNDESVLEKADHTQAIKYNPEADKKSIEALEKTVRSKSNIDSTDAKYEQLYKNPAFMSEQEIVDNMKALDDFNDVYKWVEAFPLQRKRLKNIYDRLYEPAKTSTVNGVTTSSTNDFSNEKPKTMMATVIRDKANVYPADGNKIKFIDASSPKSKGDGILKKGAKIRVLLNESFINDAPNSPSGNSSTPQVSGPNNTPVFTYHKNANGENTHYLKIQYIGTDLLYKEGFISVNAVSTYTVEQEVDDVLSSILSDNIDDLDISLDESESGWDYTQSITDTFIGSVGDSDFDFSKVKVKGSKQDYKDSSGETVDFDFSISTDKKGNVIYDKDGNPVKKEPSNNFNKDAYDITISSFSSFASLIGLVMSIRDYCNSDIHSFSDIINGEFLGVMSSLSGLTSSSLSLAQNFVPKNSDDANNLEQANTVFGILSASFDFLKFFREKVPECWEHIKKREGMDSGEVMNDLLDLLDSSNGIFNSLSSIFETVPIPIIFSSISVFSTSIKMILDIIKFIKYESQVLKMFKEKESLKEQYNITAKKEERALALEDLNIKINKLQFKGINRTSTEDKELKELLEQRSKYMDIFITNELEQINKKRRNRQILKLTQDLLDLDADISGLLANIIPEPNTIVALTLNKMGAKATSSAIGLGASAARNIKQWYRDKKADDPNSTRNKQIRYAKITAGILNNIATLPPVPTLSTNPTDEERRKHEEASNALKVRYSLVESHIIASGTSVNELSKCMGNVGQMFRIIFSALQKRE